MYGGAMAAESAKRSIERELKRRSEVNETEPCKSEADCCSFDRDKGEIEVQLERLCSAIGSAEDAMSRLTDRFDPVLQPVPPACADGCKADPGPVRSNVAGLLATYVNAVSMLRDRMDALCGRCEL